NVWVATAPRMELDWVSDTNFYIPEGPTFDNAGNLYFSPLFPPLPQFDVSLVSLNAETGELNWEIEGNGSNAGGGAILVLNDPDSPGQQIIYHMTYTEAMALRPDGSEIWREDTGLTLPPVVPGERSTTHSFGFNYHPQTDSVIGLTMNGELLAFNRLTGAQVAPMGQIPGSPAVSDVPPIPQNIVDASNALTDAVFGTTPSGLSFFSVIIDVIFGGGSLVTNFFAIDPNTGLIVVAATADDEADGTMDGLSELGAIYSLELADDGDGGLEFRILNSAEFMGGTGSTPSISEDGSRVYVSDNLGNLIALDSELNELWRHNVGEAIAASIAVSPDNAELYAVTRSDVFKLTDLGSSARLDWTATLDAFSGDPDVEIEFNALTPTITANGIAVSIGGGVSVLGTPVMLKVGVGLLDRVTGELRSFTEGREESIAVTTIGPDGGIYTASSPVRRVSGKALNLDNPEVADIIGGISRYKPIRNDLLAQDASCAAGVRARNAATIADASPASANQDIRQIQVLIDQSRAAIARAASDGDLDVDSADSLNSDLDAAEANLSVSGLAAAANDLLPWLTQQQRSKPRSET
ncbi:MAG: PQQ-like beta-propeller repeat protein, partial [Deltaproteobacteria bacterium]|nr:PQQ-like beta-propeller repeat protein [Deltaproteobacteria bacterium]